MPSPNPQCYHLSASAIAAFKACPTRFRLAYREGIRTQDDTESQRVGTNWHELHEVYAQGYQEPDGGWAKDELEDIRLNAVINLLNERYAARPASIPPEVWALERQVLLTSFMGYLWFWQNDPVEVLASEVPFHLPLTSPRTGLPLPADEVVRVGKIDHIVRWQGAVCALERKSTSRSIDPAGDYWDKAKKDTQVSMYALAFRDLVYDGRDHSQLNLVHLGDQCIDLNGSRYGNTLYDVWHRPTIKPTTLTQKETAEFLASGEYCEQQLRVEHLQLLSMPPKDQYRVDGIIAEVEIGKSGKPAIKETIEMFAARLMQDIQARPDFYFARREIARTDTELEQFQRQLYATYQAMKAAEKHGTYIENESACRATFACPYIPICYSGDGADGVCDGETTPPNFRRIFVDLTVNGNTIEGD